jgi:outer membrane protein OmpA-like peptidoglycan-associated protein
VSRARPLAAATALAALALVAAPIGPSAPAAPVPAGAQQPGGEARVVTWEPRVVDLTVRTATTDDSESSVQTPEQKAVTLAADVLFDVDRSDLNAEARTRVDELAQELSDLGGRTVTIQGHTDDQGTPDYNQALSERRATAVADRLRTNLDDEFVLEATGYGETRPVAPNQAADGTDDPEGQARNRRVVVSFPTG